MSKKKNWKVSNFAPVGAFLGAIYIIVFTTGNVSQLSPTEAKAFEIGQILGGALGGAGLGVLIAFIGNKVR